jgi:siderophore synthetase component
VIPTSQSAPPDPIGPDLAADRVCVPDPSVHRRAADRLATEALLRCWIREHAVREPAPGEDLVLDVGGSVLRVPVEYWSRAGTHRLGAPVGPLGPVAVGTVARLLGEAAGARGEHLEQLVTRAVESAARISVHIQARTAQPRPARIVTPFLVAEQGLIAGHPLHPTPKSRDALTAAEAARYSPELRGRFALHWFAAAARLATHESELGPSAPELTAHLSGLTNGEASECDRVLVPAHPWQAGELLHRAEVRKLMAEGRLEHLGEAGPPWYPTSSLRTVYRPDQPVMLKLSLGLRITNARRENLRSELLRGVEAHRLLSGRLGNQLLTAHPGFRVLTDAGYLAVEGVAGLDVAIRHSPFRRGDHAYCVAALTDLGRGAVCGDGQPHELAAHLHGLAASERRPVRAVALEWFARYVTILITPLFWLDAEHGVTLEAHQQNTLIQLDESGYPAAGWYRDNQGFHYRQSRIAHLEAISGLSGLGAASQSVGADDVVTQRLLYYVGINNLMGMVGALGCARIGDERELLGLAADLLAPLRGHRPVDLLLAAQQLRCKANLLTRAAGMDELTGALAARSVYVDLDNPFTGLWRSASRVSASYPHQGARPRGGAA